MKNLLAIFLLCSLGLLKAQETIDISHLIPKTEGTFIETGYNAYHKAQVEYDGFFTMIFERDGKYGIYEKDSKLKLPIIFDKVDIYVPGDNLLKYQGKWGTYKDGIFTVLSDPEFFSPDKPAYAINCQNEYAYKISSKHECEKQLVMDYIQEWFQDRFENLKGGISMDLHIDKNGEVTVGKCIDSTNYMIGKELTEMVNTRMNKWYPAIVDGQTVRSLVKLHFSFKLGS